MPFIDPGLKVKELGAVPFPLGRGVAKKLIGLCRVAPYGKGTQTLVNTSVRNTLELDPKQFRLGDQWNGAIAEVSRTVARTLGLPADQLEARLYKLLIYEKGGFFLPHRDSEKQNRMVASLVVVLPNPFRGGQLVVRHGSREQSLTFEDASTGTAPCFAAFYADCKHEVKRVTHGVRIALAYNLVLKPVSSHSSDGKTTSAPIDLLFRFIESWTLNQPGKPLVFALEHHYTQRGLSLELLKGGDRQLAELVVSAAEKTDCLVHLTQVSRHLQQWADDGSFGRGGYGRNFDRQLRPASIEIGETYDDELIGTQWTDIRGKKQPWEKIAFDFRAIVSSTPLVDWTPTSEDFEGYTGNAGNTLDRWYHRSAVVLWKRNHHFDVVASSGAANYIPQFCTMVARLSTTPRKRLDEARNECLRFARALIDNWPCRPAGYGGYPGRKEPSLDPFADQLLLLHDRDTIARFLSKMGEQDHSQSLKSFVVAACQEFGWGAFAPQLKGLLTLSEGVRADNEIPFRDIEWLSAFCCAPAEDADKPALARALCALATQHFCHATPRRWAYRSPDDSPERRLPETSLPHLIRALLASGCDEELSQVIHVVQHKRDVFGLGEFQVPCLKTLIPWSRNRFGDVPPQLASWLQAVRDDLQSATATPPAAPADWARPANAKCHCEYCARLNAFLADPASATGKIQAREEKRQHLIAMIDRHQCDVTHALERKGTPYSLVLRKTTGSFDRAVKQFHVDCQLLRELPADL